MIQEPPATETPMANAKFTYANSWDFAQVEGWPTTWAPGQTRSLSSSMRRNENKGLQGVALTVTGRTTAASSDVRIWTGPTARPIEATVRLTNKTSTNMVFLRINPPFSPIQFHIENEAGDADMELGTRGYFYDEVDTGGGDYVATPPRVAYDSDPDWDPTEDGVDRPISPSTSGTTYPIYVADKATTNGNVSAVTASVTISNATAGAWIRMSDGDSPAGPTGKVARFEAREDITFSTILGVDEAGRFNVGLLTPRGGDSTTIDLQITVTGYFTRRDDRDGDGYDQLSPGGEGTYEGTVAAGSTVTLPDLVGPTSVTGVPAGARSVLYAVDARSSSGPGSLSVYPAELRHRPPWCPTVTWADSAGATATIPIAIGGDNALVVDASDSSSSVTYRIRAVGWWKASGEIAPSAADEWTLMFNHDVGESRPNARSARADEPAIGDPVVLPTDAAGEGQTRSGDRTDPPTSPPVSPVLYSGSIRVEYGQIDIAGDATISDFEQAHNDRHGDIVGKFGECCATLFTASRAGKLPIDVFWWEEEPELAAGWDRPGERVLNFPEPRLSLSSFDSGFFVALPRAGRHHVRCSARDYDRALLYESGRSAEHAAESYRLDLWPVSTT